MEEKLEALWQELTFISNYVINMGVRFDFERSFFEERRKGVLSVTKISNLLSEAWQAWYGESTAGIDPIFGSTAVSSTRLTTTSTTTRISSVRFAPTDYLRFVIECRKCSQKFTVTFSLTADVCLSTIF